MYKKAIVKILVFIMIFSLIPLPVVAEEFDIDAKSAILIDSKSGDVIYEKNSHEKYAVAIYNQNNKLVGYTPKNNKRLSDSLNVWHN